MKLGIHIVSFDFPGGPASIAPCSPTRPLRPRQPERRRCRVMDHYFQMDQMAPAEQPDARGLHHARLPGRPHHQRAPRVARHRGHLPPPRPARQDRCHPRRALRRARRARASARRGTSASTAVSACRSRRSPSASNGSRRRCRSACRCGTPTTRARSTGTHYQLAETLCSPAPLSQPHPPILIGGSGERKTLRLVARYGDACNLFAASRRSGRPQARRPPPPLRRRGTRRGDDPQDDPVHEPRARPGRHRRIRPRDGRVRAHRDRGGDRHARR